MLHYPAPDFEAIAAWLRISAASLQQFILTTHSGITNPDKMPNSQLTEDQAADIVSLRPAKPAAPK
ncbi:MAG: hypothetical protein WB611_22415 [Stellaceae bacterium]